VEPFPFAAFLERRVNLNDQVHELSSGSRAISRRFSTDISQGKNGVMSDVGCSPFFGPLQMEVFLDESNHLFFLK
jgi:hypothetical protein